MSRIVDAPIRRFGTLAFDPDDCSDRSHDKDATWAKSCSFLTVKSLTELRVCYWWPASRPYFAVVIISGLSSLGLCPAGNGMMGTTTMACPIGLSHQIHTVHGASGSTYSILSYLHLPIDHADNARGSVYQEIEGVAFHYVRPRYVMWVTFHYGRWRHQHMAAHLAEARQQRQLGLTRCP